MRVFEPRNGQQRFGLQPCQPHVAPAVADQRRVWRSGRVGKHSGRPTQVFIEQAAAFVVNVVAEAVVGGAQGDDGFEAWRTARGDLQAVEATPGNAHHADLAAAPGLLHQPGNHGFGIGQLLLGVFVEHDAVRVTVAAHVHPHAGVAVACQVGVGQGVAHDGAVALAVGQVFEHRRHRPFVSVGREPHPGRELSAVGQRNEQVGNFPDLAWKRLDRLHGASAFILIVSTARA